MDLETIQFRAAIPQDFEQIAAAYQETLALHRKIAPLIFKGDPPNAPPYWEHAFTGGPADAPHAPAILVAESHGRIAGYVALTRVKDTTAPKPGHPVGVSDIWVAEDMRGHGLGKDLVKKAESWARDFGASAFQATVWGGNAASVALMESTGQPELYRLYYQMWDDANALPDPDKPPENKRQHQLTQTALWCLAIVIVAYFLAR